MTNKTNNTNANTRAVQELDLHAAIAGVLLHFKGTKTIDSLAKAFGMPRKRLAELFGKYQAFVEKREPDDTEKEAEWGFKHIKDIADKLGFHLSDLIRSAEDLQEGLPPWFHARISENTAPRSKEELINVVLEALGCHTYGMKDTQEKLDALVESAKSGKRKRRSFKHSANDPFPGDAAITLKLFVGFLLNTQQLKEFINAYKEGKITSEEAYRELKGVMDTVIGDIGSSIVKDEEEALSRVNRIGAARDAFTEKIASKIHRLLEKKGPNQGPNKKNR